MIRNTAIPSDRVNGLRALELGAALFWLKENLALRLKGGSRTISTVGHRTKDEQEIVGISQILFVMLPLAIELALKSLKGYLHTKGQYDHIHELDKLFESLTLDARNKDEAQHAQDEARAFWNRFQADGLLKYSGTLDDFLAEHSKDFVEIRYYDWSKLKDTPTDDLLICFYSIIQALITRDSEIGGNFLALSVRQRSGN